MKNRLVKKDRIAVNSGRRTSRTERNTMEAVSEMPVSRKVGDTRRK